MTTRGLAVAALTTLTSVAVATTASGAGSLGARATASSAASAAPAASVASAAAPAKCSMSSAGRRCFGAVRVLSSRTTKDTRGRTVRTVVTRQVTTLTTSSAVRTTTTTTTSVRIGRAAPVTRKRTTVRTAPRAAGQRRVAPVQPATAAAASVSTWERRVFALTNAERVKAGLAPFRVDACANASARTWSSSMLRTNRYEHSSSWAPLEACAAAAGRWSGLAENIYHGNAGWELTPEKAVAGWMSSPGHRANILNRAYTRMGVGFAGSPSAEHYATQHFWG